MDPDADREAQKHKDADPQHCYIKYPLTVSGINIQHKNKGPDV
jgi:hypothetical protein